MKLMVLALALAVSGCRIAPVKLGSDSARGQSLSKRTEFGEKVVNMKRSNFTFVAKDGSRCQVDEETWRGTHVGDRATCAWEFVEAGLR